MTYLVNVISNAVEGLLRKVKVRRLGNFDIQTPRQATPFGIDSAPMDKMVAVYADTNKKGKPVILGYLNKSLLAANGEIRVFSLDADGVLATSIWLKADGTMEIGGSTKHMARFEELKSGFDQLKTDLNDMKQKWNTFAAAYVPGSPSVTGTPPTASQSSASTASIDSAKIDEIKTL